MREWVPVALALLAGCGPGAFNGQFAPDQQAAIERMRAEDARCRSGGCQARPVEPDSSSLTPSQRARRDLETAKSSRENDLLERAITSSPDYTSAVRRAAVANVDGEAAIPPAAGAPRRTATNARAREAAISVEEARLSDAVEIRRRQRLADQGRERQGQQDQQAAANCIALGQQIEASMYRSRSILNLEAAATGAQARENCWANYQQSR